MNDPVIECFRNEFDRFFDLMKKQVAICPDELWNTKEGGYVFWQQIFHTAACVEIYALPEGNPSQQTMYSREVVMLSSEAPNPMSKEELLAFLDKMQHLAHSFMEEMTQSKLTERNEKLSKILGKNMTNQNALIALIRHTCYHLGCCDTVLRVNGLPGVY